jgi:hypothetical protein
MRMRLDLLTLLVGGGLGLPLSHRSLVTLFPAWLYYPHPSTLLFLYTYFLRTALLCYDLMKECSM